MGTLTDFKGKYRGRIFLLGCGPSLLALTGEERRALAGEHTFAGARYFKWKEGIIPSFYILAEEGQAVEWQKRGFGKARASLAKFWVGWQPAPSGWVQINAPPSLSFHHYTLPETRLSPLEGECDHIHMGHDVPIAMLQVAKYMGFTEFYLIGVDQTAVGYAWDLKERRKVGDRFATMAPLYRKASREAGGRLYDCTAEGRLSAEGVLPHRVLAEVLGHPSHQSLHHVLERGTL